MLLGTQFASALADNALLIVAMALLYDRGLPAWWAPVLKFGFTLSYVVLAPLLGPLADSVSKSRLMRWMNGIKALGVIGLLMGMHPVLSLCLVGLGSAGYAPAKYGLLADICGTRLLVTANGWLEGSVVAAVVIGTALGGALIGPDWRAAVGWAGQSVVLPAPLTVSLFVLLGVYGCSALMNLGIPIRSDRLDRPSFTGRALWLDFAKANWILWRDIEAATSLAATTVFWGAAASLQFLLLQWADDALNMPLHEAAYLQVVVAVGVVAGALVAGRWVDVQHAGRTLCFGVILGCLLPVLTIIESPLTACLVLFFAGSMGGLMLVPLNALLQHRGHLLLSTGRSVAIQGFCENAGVLVILAAYAAIAAFGVPIELTLWLLGAFIAGSTACLMWLNARSRGGRRALA